MKAFNQNLTFAAIDVDRLLQERPEEARRILKSLVQLFHEGHFQAMPVTSFAAKELPDAFHYIRSLPLGTDK